MPRFKTSNTQEQATEVASVKPDQPRSRSRSRASVLGDAVPVYQIDENPAGTSYLRASVRMTTTNKRARFGGF
jgi:hypothetical protein